MDALRTSDRLAQPTHDLTNAHAALVAECTLVVRLESPLYCLSNIFPRWPPVAVGVGGSTTENRREITSAF